MDILDTIRKDMEDGIVSGVESVDCYGRECHIFLDLGGFLCDYYEASNGLDTLAHGESSPSNLCNIRAFNSIRDTGPKWSATSFVHSGNCATRR